MRRVRAKRSLEESEELFELLMTYSPIYVFFKDEGIRALRLSRNYEKMLGRPMADLIGRTMNDLFPSALAQSIVEDDRRILREGLPIEVEEELDGRVYTTMKFPIRREGKPALLAGFTIDITDRRRAEEALRASEQKLADILNSMQDALYSLDARTSALLLTNAAMTRIFGRSPRELGGNPLLYLEAVHRDDRERVRESVALVMDGGESETMYRIFRPDGEMRWVSERARLIRDAGGEPLRVDRIFTDISEQKRGEERLGQRELQYRTILTTTRDGFLLVDDRGKILDVNDTLCGLLGYSKGELLSMSLADLEAVEDTETFARHAREVGEKGFDRFETRHRRRDGSIIDVEVSVSHMPAGNRNIAFIRDLTEHKRLEEQFRQSQKMESIGRLAGGVAHDFNNILTTIIGNAELGLSSLSPTEPVRAQIVEIKKAAERAANLTRQLLAFSRRQIISPRILNLNELILDMNNMLQRLIGEHIELFTHGSPDLWPVSIDPGQIEQVLTNLVVNARDAMPDGGKLTIDTANMSLDEEYAKRHPDAAPGDYVMVAVADTGTGMDADVLSHLFEPFFTTKPRGSGTGLGLSTCFGIVKQNCGSISVESERGGGTTVRVYLPALTDTPIVHTAGGEQVAVSQGTETILVAEDEPSVRRMIVSVLEGKGYVVLAACNGAEAMGALNAAVKAPGVLITDVIMPDMNGKELSDLVVARCPNVKVLFMSGYTDDSIVHQSVLNSGVEFIQKPFSTAALVLKVRELLHREP